MSESCEFGGRSQQRFLRAFAPQRRGAVGLKAKRARVGSADKGQLGIPKTAALGPPGIVSVVCEGPGALRPYAPETASVARSAMGSKESSKAQSSSAALIMETIGNTTPSTYTYDTESVGGSNQTTTRYQTIRDNRLPSAQLRESRESSLTTLRRVQISLPLRPPPASKGIPEDESINVGGREREREQAEGSRNVGGRVAPVNQDLGQRRHRIPSFERTIRGPAIPSSSSSPSSSPSTSPRISTSTPVSSLERETHSLWAMYHPSNPQLAIGSSRTDRSHSGSVRASSPASPAQSRTSFQNHPTSLPESEQYSSMAQQGSGPPHRQSQPWETSRGQPPGFGAGGGVRNDGGGQGAYSGDNSRASAGDASAAHQYRDIPEATGGGGYQAGNWAPTTFSSMGNPQTMMNAAGGGGGESGQMGGYGGIPAGSSSYPSAPSSSSTQYGRVPSSPAYQYLPYPSASTTGSGYNQNSVANSPMSEGVQVAGYSTPNQTYDTGMVQNPQYGGSQQQESLYGQGMTDNRIRPTSSSSSSMLIKQQQQAPHPNSLHVSPHDYRDNLSGTMQPSQANNMARRPNDPYRRPQDSSSRSPSSFDHSPTNDFGGGAAMMVQPGDRRRTAGYMEDDNGGDGGGDFRNMNSGKKRKLDSDNSSSRGRRGGGASSMYELVVRQQPERARLCSFKEENDTIDRRPVDPPPIVQILGTSGQVVGHMLENTSFFVRVRLVASQPTEGEYNRSNSPDSSTWPEQRLPQGNEATTGEALQTPEKLRDLDGHEGAFCVFGRLSIRMPGIFRLRFVLYQTKENGIEEITSCLSDPFEVFSPKLFKGMKQSTPLTRHFASQGLKIKLRQDATAKPRKKKETAEDGRGESGDAQASMDFRVPQGSAGAFSPYQQRQFSEQLSNAANYSSMSSRSPHFPSQSGHFPSQQQSSRNPDDRTQGAGSGAMGPPHGLMSLPPLTTALPPSVWYTNPSSGGGHESSTGQSYGSQGGVAYQQGNRHGGDDGALPPMSFGRPPQPIYEGMIPTTPGGGLASGGSGASDLASFSLKNISGQALPSGFQHGSSMANQSGKRFDEDLHRMFEDGSAGGQSTSNSAQGQEQNSRSPMPPARDVNTMRLTLPAPKTKH